MKPRIDGSRVSLVFAVLACLGLGLATVGVAESRRPKNVEVALRVKWSGTPLLLEAGELLSKESNDLFWKFVEGWLYDEENNYDSSTARECLKKISSLGRSLLGVSLGPLYEFSLLLRSASPRLVVYRQLAEESLSSFPLVEDTSLRSNGNGSHRETENSNSKKHESLLIGTNPTSPSGKCCWVDTGEALFFDTAELISWLDTSPEIGGEEFLQPGVFEFDHVYPESNITSPVAVLYGALGTICFMELHGTLAEAAKKGRVMYVLRSVLPSGCEAKVGHCGAVGTGEFSKLGGYGVELALKNMEYKAMDDSAVKKGLTLEDPRTEDLSQDVRGFIFSKILERRPELASEINAFRDYMLSSTISDNLDVWELKDLGHQTAQRIVQASDPLQSMLDINQNFPSVVSSLSRMKLNESVKEEILANQRMIPPGKSLMALNGALINVEDVDLFQLIDLVHQDLSLADQFARMKISPSTIRKLLRSMPPSESSAFRIDFRSSHVHYLNNLEEDARYRRWRSNINEILMPVFPGQLRYIRKNLYHAVYVIDPGSICGLEAIDMIMSLYENDLPMRFGVILYSLDFIERNEKSTDKDSRNNDDLSLLIIRLFLYVEENHGTQSAFQFLSNVNRLRIESAESDEALEVHHVEGAFVDTVLPKAKTPPQDILLKLERDQSFQLIAQESSIFVYKLGFSNSGCHLLMNGLVLEANEEALLNAMNEELPRIQEQVYYGHINSHTNVLDKFLTENGVSRYNPQIIAASKTQMTFISLSASAEGGDSVLHEINYLHSSETVDDLKPVTHLLAVDIMSEKGIKLLHEGLNYLIQGSKLGRLGVLFTTFQDTDVSSLIFAEVFERAVSSYSHKEGILKFLDQLCLFHEHKDAFGSLVSDESIQQFMDKVYELADENFIPAKAFKSIFSGSSMDNMREKLGNATQFLHRMMGSRSTDNVVITNGRVLFPPANGSFTGDDLRLLESVEFNQRIKHVMEVIEAADWQNIDPDILTSKFFSDVIMVSSSAMAKRERSTEGARFEILNAQYSSVTLGDENSSLHVDVVIDPLSSSGQKLASLLQILWKHVKPTMRIILNPLSSLVDLPLKNYYRFVAPTLDDYSIIDHLIHGPRAFFVNMPLSKTLTMNLDVPEPWLIEPVIAVHDLDNILLENLGETRTLQAVFELESLVLTGHCSEKDHDPPRGLQLILGTKSQPHLVDTLVMANLGYWQMKVSPGVWYLQLAPGRSSELYHLMENDGASQDEPSSKRITINDLRGKVVYLEVLKKKGKEHESLLSSTDDDDQSREKRGNQNSWNSNILRWASGLLGGSEQSKKQSSLPGKGERHGRTINIFSVASGHLYERFLKIMILSVLKNTQRPVKFWFIKNYLSPPFKDVIPHMAREYGFEYELITYKWPSWLHKQKEKQRIIWAYKILFLDVIFPLSLEKVIFVDADQIVRADMGELYDMDLKGRPLAYTPFCDNNKEMDGYRFWRQGFWKEHLRGRPYHISALYVVDLVTFRQTAAGDNLRVFYESLSKDPNSLSNLDQDLPNYAQHTVPIFSLPQDWLWCESWCGTATKSKAKTIDLCNNPMTKEPKLQGARRIVPEWTDLDSEARHFTAKILGDEPSPIEPHVTSADPEQASEGAATSYDIEEKSPEKSFEDLESKLKPHVTSADPEQASEGAATSYNIEEKSPDKSFEDVESKSEL